MNRPTCSYAHRMKTTRGHAPILEVLAAAGVQIYSPRSVRQDSAASANDWRQHVYVPQSSPSGNGGGRREKRRDCDDAELCGVVGTTPTSSPKHFASSAVAARQVSRRQVPNPEDADSEGDRDRERPRIATTTTTQQRQAALERARAHRAKKGPRTVRVANPDRKRTQSTEKYEVWRPSKEVVVGNETQNGYEREEDEAYMLTHEMLSYSFGNR